MKVPNSFKLSELADELKQREDQYHSLSIMSYMIVPGDGCPCDDCKKDRKDALNELNKQIHAQNKQLVHQNCPQRTVHDMNKAEQIMDQKIEQLKNERNRWKAMAIWFAKKAKFRRVTLAALEEMFGVTWKWDEFTFDEQGEQQ